MAKFKLKSKVSTFNLLSFFLEFGNAALLGYMLQLLASVISTRVEMISLIKLDSVTVEIKSCIK